MALESWALLLMIVGVVLVVLLAAAQANDNDQVRRDFYEGILSAEERRWAGMTAAQLRAELDLPQAKRIRQLRERYGEPPGGVA